MIAINQAVIGADGKNGHIRPKNMSGMTSEISRLSGSR